jgi:oligopeptidase A
VVDNPLLTTPEAGVELPSFDRIRPDDAEPAVDEVLAANRASLERLFAGLAEGGSGQNPETWESIVQPLEDLAERLSRAWGPVVHLFAVTSTAAWRAAHNACLPKVTRYHVELSQDVRLLGAYERLASGAGFAGFGPSRQKVVRDALRDFKLSGVSLPEAQRARFGETRVELSELQSKFQENVVDSAQAWHKDVADEAFLAGMTAQGKAAAQAKARAKGQDGFRLTLDFPSYDAVIRYADNRSLREEVYEAYATRASDRGPLAGRFDNGPLIDRMLALRQEQASLLGFRNYAEVSLQTKMAESPDDVERFLLDLNRRARPRALSELAELETFAKERDGLGDFRPWDLPYYAEKLKARQLGFSQDDLRPYFPASAVIRGVFGLAERLYGLRIEQVNDVPVWHPDVTTYRLRESDGNPVGMFYFDPYARDDKRGGAWMAECVGRRRTAAGVQRPAAYVVCNFAPPLPGKPALLAHEEVVTLFHEFGHCLHHLLTRVDEAAVAGIQGVEWDAVELPSQFMENWCYDEATLATFARHFESGDPLPSDLLRKLRASRTFHAGLMTVRQLEFALFDLRLHRREASNGRVLETLAEVRREVAVLTPPEYGRMPNSFLHIFAGDYAAGYYSYKWAEVLSADAYAAFEESGFAPETGRRFRDAILAQGGSRKAMDLFVGFRGRKPTVDALLRQGGFVGNP